LLTGDVTKTTASAKKIGFAEGLFHP